MSYSFLFASPDSREPGEMKSKALIYTFFLYNVHPKKREGCDFVLICIAIPRGASSVTIVSAGLSELGRLHFNPWSSSHVLL